MSSKNKSYGRKVEARFIAWLASIWNLTVFKKNRDGSSNIHDFDIARSEEINQHLDNQGVDIYLNPRTGINHRYQCKGTTTSSINTKAIDVQPLFDLDIDFLLTEIRVKKKKNKMNYGEVVTMRLDVFEQLIKDKHELQRTSSTESVDHQEDNVC